MRLRAIIVLVLLGTAWGQTETVLYSFGCSPDGSAPYAGLTWDSVGNLYGATTAGSKSGDGTVFELSSANGSWTETVLHNFNGNDGARPYAGVVFDSHGNLYGTTAGGNRNGKCYGSCGTVFRLTHTGSGWVFAPIYDSCNWDPQFGQIVAEARHHPNQMFPFRPAHVTTSQLLLF